jgi:hypothetical protein
LLCASIFWLISFLVSVTIAIVLIVQNLYLMDHICQTAATFSEVFNFSLEYGAISSEVRDKYLKPQQNNRTETKSGKNITDLLQKVMIFLKSVTQEIL